MSSIRTSDHRQGQSLVNTVDGVVLECFQVGFYWRFNMWSSNIMEENNFVISRVVLDPFF